jgi:protein-disulfide isomerase
VIHRFLSSLALAALTIVGAAGTSPAEAQVRGTAQRDWTGTIAATPAGGFRMGSPNAPAKVVEYVSLTCPHCRTFAQEGVPAMRQDIASGRISFELRNFVLNPLDEAAAVLNRCAATPAQYWALNDAILAEQPIWTGRIGHEEYERISALPDNQRLLRFATATGLDAIAARHGVTSARARYCLTNPARLARVRGMKAAGEAAGVQGTPTFSIDGAAPFVADWSILKPMLRRGS